MQKNFTVQLQGCTDLTLPPLAQPVPHLTPHHDHHARSASAIIKTMQIIVLLNYNCIMSTGASSANSAYPRPYSIFVDMFEFTALDLKFLPMTCVSGQRFGHVEYLLGCTLVPLFIVLFGTLGVELLRKLRPRDHRYVFEQQLTCTFVVLILPSVARTICQSFRCVEYDGSDGMTHKYLLADMQIDCSSNTYDFVVGYASVAVLIWPIGVPLGLFMLLWPQRHRLDPKAETEVEALQIREEDTELSHSIALIMWRKYRPRYWWYEVFDMMRRLCLTCFVLVFRRPGLMISFALGVAMLTTVIQRESQPYIDIWLESLVNLAHWQVSAETRARTFMLPPLEHLPRPHRPPFPPPLPPQPPYSRTTHLPLPLPLTLTVDPLQPHRSLFAA